jgi:hypothetical protein
MHAIDSSVCLVYLISRLFFKPAYVHFFKPHFFYGQLMASSFFISKIFYLKKEKRLSQRMCTVPFQRIQITKREKLKNATLGTHPIIQGYVQLIVPQLI